MHIMLDRTSDMFIIFLPKYIFNLLAKESFASLITYLVARNNKFSRYTTIFIYKNLLVIKHLLVLLTSPC